MTKNRSETENGLNGIFIVLLSSVVLPLFLVGLVLLFGQGWDGNDEARYYDYILIGAVILIFASDWIRDQPVWKRFPAWVRNNGSDMAIFIVLAVLIGWQDADPELSGGAWWLSFGAEFLMMLVFFSAFYVLSSTIGLVWKRRKQRKTAE
jgi:hypothetical protein